MLRLARGTRLQHVIVNSFPSSGTKPTPIWSLRDIEPDSIEREKLRKLIEINGVSEVDFLRWRNACVAPNIKDAFDYICGAESSTPLWVTSHMLRRKIHNARDASLAAHLALLAVPSSETLAPAHETPLILTLEHITKYGLVYALPAVLSRVLALPGKNHRHLVSLFSSTSLTPSPIVTDTLKTLVEDIMGYPRVLSPGDWLQIWERWGRNRTLGEDFSGWLLSKMREIGVSLPLTYHPPQGKIYTQGAFHFKPDTTHAPDSTTASLKAAAESKHVSGRLLLAVAHTLIRGFYPRPPDPQKPPDETFLAILINGLVERKAYERAKAVWSDTERKISPLSKSSPLSLTPNSTPRTLTFTLTPELFNAGLSVYATSGDLRGALDMLDRYALISPATNKSSLLASPQAVPHRGKAHSSERPHATPTALNQVLPHLPPHAQHMVFTHSSLRWGIQPDSLSLETVMQSALRIVKGVRGEDEWSSGQPSFRENLREFGEGFRQILTRGSKPEFNRLSSDEPETKDEWSWYEKQLNLALDPAHRTRDKSLIRQNAIDLFQSVIFGNWPFLAGLEIDIASAINDKTQTTDSLSPRNMALFVPSPLQRKLFPKSTYSPKPKAPETLSLAPLHPSPTPRFPNAHPSAQAWTAYLALIPAQDLPEALGWMRAADESTRQPSGNFAITETRVFRPEKAALVDALVRWEALELARETMVERALHERQRSSAQGNRDVGPEGALRDWLEDWLGSPNVPSREKVAQARLDGYDLDVGL
ncbi:hypothetical protein RhiJN_23561 [Ceratobasidium sp. AG-Ba]|nr:hypothetical protein RhiJN_23561 [Ceratobasidium sp. AG-Ba]